MKKIKSISQPIITNKILFEIDNIFFKIKIKEYQEIIGHI